MPAPTASQVEAAVGAAKAAVTRITGFDVTRFISQAVFDEIITEIVTAALTVNDEPPPNQPLAP